MAEMDDRVGKLVCPKCGNNGQTEGHEIRFVETVEVYRKVIGPKDGLLEVDGFYQSGEGYDDETKVQEENRQFECHGKNAAGHWCGHRWPVPDWVYRQIDWVCT